MKNTDLKDFVKATLKAIIDGAYEASEEIPKEQGLIAPAFNTQSPDKKTNFEYDIQDVEFDVAVTASEKADGSIKTGVSILGADAEFSKENIFAQRIKFRVPIGIKKGKDKMYEEQKKLQERPNDQLNHNNKSRNY